MTLPEERKEDLERELRIAELYSAIGAMKANRVPGKDGLTKEFYVTFWDVIGHHLLDVFKEIFAEGKMLESMRTGVVSMLYKKGHPSQLANYRPLSMLCVDYKILSRTLAKRLANAMPFNAEMDQTCGVKGRQIVWNLHLHRDMLAYIEEKNLAAICVSWTNRQLLIG